VKILVEIERTSYGMWLIDIVSKKIKAKAVAWLQSHGAWTPNDRYMVALQYSQDQESFVETFGLSKTNVADIEAGFVVRKLVDPWTFFQGYVGYDAGDNQIWNLTLEVKK
jgi:hypothetical protein